MMIKKFTSVAAFIFLLGIINSSAQNVAVSVDMPAVSYPDSTFTVELTVDKGSISGFAKLQQEVPTGFNATPLETANATFSFKDRKVKYLWMALPNSESFKVSYNVKVDPNILGTQIVEGTFAYIRNNETEKYSIPKEIISIEMPQEKQEVPPTRVVEPESVTATPEPKTGEPTEPEMGTEEEDVVVADEEALEEVMEPEEEEPVAVEQPKPEPKPQPKPEPKPEPKPQPKPQPKPEPVAKSQSMSKDGLVFRAQIAAGHNRVSGEHFKNKFNLTDEVHIEDHEGWVKYTVGDFGSYRAAKTYSNNLRDNNGVEGSFVTAYYNGNRIHVQEALDIAAGRK